ncbi:hypothetical protein [Nitrosophilus alvini]|uniref:hypothetical protein n=1 Tax=Nitrosophilus alvini TaxID=2714855 RepID=UPI00190E2DD6|nr:hypothetical protein [Nitrosophilus alvini]
MINLEDFSHFNGSQIDEIENKSPKEVEAFYKKQIAKIQENYEAVLRKNQEEYYKKGYEEAKKEAEEEFEKRLRADLEALEKSKNEEIDEIKKKYASIEDEIKLKLEEYICRLSDILLENIETILEFLYIRKENHEYIQSAIEKIVYEFKESLPLSIRTGKEIYPLIKENFKKIEITEDSDIDEGDFVIEFHDFKLQNKIREKIEVLKDEIKREIKKFT